MKVSQILRAVIFFVIIDVLLLWGSAWLMNGSLLTVFFGQGVLHDQGVMDSMTLLKRILSDTYIHCLAAYLTGIHFLGSLSFRKKWAGMIRGLSLLACVGILIIHLVQVVMPSVMVVQKAKMYQYSAEHDEQVYSQQVNGMPVIEVQSDQEYPYDVEQIKQAVAAMPEFLLENCAKIYIMDEAHYLQTGKQLKVANLKNTAAFSYSSDMSIYIRIITDPQIEKDYLHTVSHELCHIYDFSKGDLFVDPSGCSNSDEFMRLYQAAPDSVSEYGSTSQYEFFAEAGSLYILDPYALYYANPDVYDYFDSLFGPYYADQP